MFKKRLLGVAVACAMAGAVGIANGAPTLSIVDASGNARTANDAQVEHTGDPGGSVYPWPGGPGAGAGIPWRTVAGSGWPNGPGMGPDVGPPGFPSGCTGANCNLGASGWHMSYLLLDLNGATSADVTFQFMGAGDSGLRNSFWVDLPAGVGTGGWVQLFQDGQNPPTATGFTNPCPVTPSGATFPSCDRIAPPGVISSTFEYNQYTFAFTAADLFADDGGTYIPFAFDLNNNPPPFTPGNPSGNPAAGPINAPGVAWGNSNYPNRTGNPDTSLANSDGSPGFFLGADPYLVNANHVSTGLEAVYAGLTDRPCTTAGCDHDFQDMGVRITVETPEPGTLALIGVALCGLVVARRYAARACVSG